MYVPQKIHYALRALFELAKSYTPERAVLRSVQDISRRQDIPHKFLEGLLNSLKRGGFVVSFRGKNGGYHLARRPDQVRVVEVMRFLQGPLYPVSCLEPDSATCCPQKDRCVFLPMWQRVFDASMHVYENTTLEDFVMQEQKNRQEFTWDYVI